MKKYKIVALVPMKANSERLPNKNMKIFNGKPLYHSVLNSLLNSKYIDKIIINTDSEIIIKDLSIFFPEVLVHERPIKIRGDNVSMNKIIDYDLSQINADIYLQTHSTNPLILSKTIDFALEQYINHDSSYDSLFSVTRHQSRFYWNDCTPVNHNPDELIRTQDLNPIFEENSNLYIFTKKSFFENGKKRIGKKPFLFEMEKNESIDIDELNDFELAEILIKKQI